MSTRTKVIILAILAVIVIGIVIALAFIATPKEGVGDIKYKDFDKLIKKDVAIYYGKESKKKGVKDFSETYNVEISVLNPDDLSKSEIKSLGLKDEHLYFYSKGKQVYDLDFYLVNYKKVKELMDKGLIERSYIEVNLSEYKEIQKSKGYNVLFIGRETCSWCGQFKTSINTALQNNNFNVYYIDTDKFTQEQYNELYATDSYLTEEEWGTPLTFIYKDGKRIDVINGYVEASALVDTLKKNKVL